jgi:hypothetical protein
MSRAAKIRELLQKGKTPHQIAKELGVRKSIILKAKQTDQWKYRSKANETDRKD